VAATTDLDSPINSEIIIAESTTRFELATRKKSAIEKKNALDTASGQFGKLEERIDDVKKLKAGS